MIVIHLNLSFRAEVPQLVPITHLHLLSRRLLLSTSFHRYLDETIEKVCASVCLHRLHDLTTMM